VLKNNIHCMCGKVTYVENKHGIRKRRLNDSNEYGKARQQRKSSALVESFQTVFAKIGYVQ